MSVFEEMSSLLLPGGGWGIDCQGCRAAKGSMDLSAETRSKCDLTSGWGEANLPSLVVILDYLFKSSVITKVGDALHLH